MFRNTEKFFYCFILSIGFGMLPFLSWAQEDGIISDQYGEKLGKIDKDGIISNKYGESQGKIDKDGIVSNKYGESQGKIDKDGIVYDKHGQYIGRADVNHPISALLLLKKSQKE